MDGARWKRWRPTPSVPSVTASNISTVRKKGGCSFPYITPSNHSEEEEEEEEEKVALCSHPDPRPILVSPGSPSRMCRTPKNNFKRASVRFRQDLEEKKLKPRKETTSSSNQILLHNCLARTSSEEDESYSDSNTQSPRCLIPERRSESRCRRWYDEKSQVGRRYTNDSFHAWSSLDLRNYLVRKAHNKLGPPQASLDSDCEEIDPSASSNEVLAVSGRLNDTSTTNTTTTASSCLRRPSTNRKKQKFVNNFVSSRGTDIFQGNVVYRTCIGPRGSLQLDRINFPGPRQRFWSLPTIIVTQWDNVSNSDNGRDEECGTDSTSPASSRNSDVTPMHYLTVPQHVIHSPIRHGSSREDAMRRISSCSELSEIDENNLGTQFNTLQLGSLLSLWPPEDDDEYDSDSNAGVGVRGSPEVLQYENSYVSNVFASLCDTA